MRSMILFMLGWVCTVLVQAQPTAETPEFIQQARQLTYAGARAGEGYFSPDGTQLIFQSEREADNPFYQIYILDLNTGDINRVSPGSGKTTCAFFDGSNPERVLFASTHHDPEAVDKQQAELEFRASGQQRRYSWDYDTTMDIFSAHKDGSHTVQLTDAPGYDAEGSYSPDGSKIAFCSLRDAYNRSLSKEERKILEVDPAYFGEIYIMNADGSNPVRLTDTPGYDGGPFFSPDGKRIIWRRFEENGVIANIYSMNLDGSDKRQLTDFGSMSWAPYYHPSGEYIIFASNKHGFDNFELFIVDADGQKEPVRVTALEGFDGLPVFSPDGTKLAWTANRTSTGKSQIFYGTWDHGLAREVLKSAPERGEHLATFSGDILVRDLKTKVSYLADDKLEGRMTGSEGNRKAAKYIEHRMQAMGLQPFSPANGFMQSFPYISSIQVNPRNTTLQAKLSNKKQSWKPFEDFIPMSFSANGMFEGEVVFAGYGLKTPDQAGVDYNSYANVDVKDKAVIVLNEVPPHLSDAEKKEVIRYATPRYKALMARQLGAAAIIFVSERKGSFSGIGKESIPGHSGMLALQAHTDVIDAWLQGKSTSLAAIRKGFEQYIPHQTYEFALDDVSLDLQIQLDKVEQEDVNVLGMIPSGTGSDRYILIGGHYDHLGRGETSSLADDAHRTAIHNGADDNASGTAVVMELAEYFSALQQLNPGAIKHNLVFALWSGEEIGLIGSNYFAEHAPVPMDQFNAYINFDMVGMLNNNRLVLQGLGSAPEWRRLVEKKNIPAGFDLVLQEDPYVPTDAMSLYTAGVPVLCFFTGIHDHYHKPSDDIGNLNYEGMERITKLAAGIINEVMSMDSLTYNKVEMTQTLVGATRGFSIYLGTIPDYVAEVEGVKLSGVRAGGPADKAGVRAGDIIVKLGGKEILNIYDYTYILGDLKADQTVDMVVMREGKQLTLSITPIAR